MRDLLTSLVCASLALAACGPNRGDDDDDGPTGDGGPGDGTNADGCSAESKLIYTIDENNTLATFDPVSKTFNNLGELNCPASLGASPFSMGIDRNAGAYVLFNSGELFKVDTTSLACTQTAWQGSLSLQVFGMGFSTDVAGGTTDTLFIAGGFGPTDPTSSLNRLDVNTFSPTPVGTVNDWPELTGTGDAELWGFFPSTTNPRIDQLNKTNGAAMQSFPLQSLNGMPQAWAFAFFGGNFYVFLMRDNESATTVHEVNDVGAITDSITTNGRTIVGAGVSTCAPTVIL
jgi:hypothetical protein